MPNSIDDRNKKRLEISIGDERRKLVLVSLGDNEERIIERILDVLRERRPKLLIADEEVANKLHKAARWYRADSRAQNRPGTPGLGEVANKLASAATHLDKGLVILGAPSFDAGPTESLIHDLLLAQLPHEEDHPYLRLDEMNAAVMEFTRLFRDAHADAESRRTGRIRDGDDDVAAQAIGEGHRRATGATGDPASDAYLEEAMHIWQLATGDELSVTVGNPRSKARRKPTGRALEYLRLCLELAGTELSDEAIRHRVRSIHQSE